MTEYSRMARGHFTSTGGAQIINLPFQPDYVELTNFTSSAAFTDHAVLAAQWDADMGQGFAITQVKNTTYQTDSIVANGISTFAAGQLLQFGAAKQVVSTTKASPTQIEVTGHGFSDGDVVIFQGLYSTQFTAGMPQLNGIPFTVTVLTANTFSVPWDSTGTNYTALAASPSGAFVKKVLYPYLYAPGTAFISAITAPNGTTIPTGTVKVDTTSAHNFVVGQEVALRIPTDETTPSIWGSIELNSLPNTSIPGSPTYGYVVTVTDYNTVIVKINNSASFTAFSVNVPVADLPGLSYPQIVAVGDVNTGGTAISSSSVLYPPPTIMPIGSTTVNTINGPAIRGAYFNNTSQGFVIGAGTCVTDTAAVLVGSADDVIYWRAFLHDMNVT